MAKVTATAGKERYKTVIRSDTNSIIANEPIDLGREDSGFSPSELLASALASCTSITLRMYANRNNWNLDEIKVEVTFERNRQTNISVFQRDIYLTGNLDEKQKQRLWAIANTCPIHKTLTGTIEIKTEIKRNGDTTI